MILNRLLDPHLALQEAYVPYDFRHFVEAETGYWRHVAELPVMSTDAALDRVEERDIGVMRGLVDDVYQGWPLARPERSLSVAGRAVGGEERLAGLELGRNINLHNDLGELGLGGRGGVGAPGHQSGQEG